MEKNWHDPDSPAGVVLRSAQLHLETAARSLQERSSEFLTAVTLAEVFSYSEATLPQAAHLSDDMIRRIERLVGSNEADPGQLLVLNRAYMLRGNVEYLERNMKELAPIVT